MATTINRLITRTNEYLSERGDPGSESMLTGAAAVCQDANIYGIDVEDFVAVLESEFGKIVWEIPWGRFTDQTSSFRGCGCLLVPFWLAWRLVRFPLMGGPLIRESDPKNFPFRLTFNHIAAVIDRGEWFEPS